MTRQVFKNLLLAAAAAAASPAWAGTETGTVRFSIGQHLSSATTAGMTFFFLDGGTHADPPACATYSSGDRWVIHNDWPAAKIQMAVLLAAATSGKRVTIRGSGDCGVYSNTETARDIFLVD